MAARKASPKGKGPKTTKKVPAAVPGKYDAQVSAESTLRFSPERTALQQALDDVVGQRTQEIGAAQGAAAGLTASAKAAIPQVQTGQADAAGLIDDAAKYVDPMSPGGGNDVARTRGTLATRMAAAVADLGAVQTDAAKGRLYAVNSANDRAGANAQKIRQQYIDLGQREGAFAQGRVADLTGADTKLAHDDRQARLQRESTANNALMSAGINPDGTVAVGGPRDRDGNGVPGNQGTGSSAGKPVGQGGKRNTPEQHLTAASKISQAKTIAAQLKAGAPGIPGLTRRQAAEALLAQDPGAPASQPKTVQLHDPSTGKPAFNKDGTPKMQTVAEGSGKVPGHEAFTPLWASVALDLAYDGGVSRANVKRLQENKYSVNQLGLITQTSRGAAGLPKRPSKASTYAGGPGSH